MSLIGSLICVNLVSQLNGRENMKFRNSKNYSIFSLLSLFIFVAIINSAGAETTAMDEVSLYSKFTGEDGLNQFGWFLVNKSESNAIMVTVKFTDLTRTKNNTTTKSFSLEPGSDEHIGIKSQFSAHTTINTAAKIVGARYL